MNLFQVYNFRKVATLYRERLNDLLANGANSSELDRFVKVIHNHSCLFSLKISELF